MPSPKNKKPKKQKQQKKPTPIPSHDLEKTMSLKQIMETLGLDKAAELLETATQKAITRNDSPTKLLDYLMREQLRVHVERRAFRALKRSAIFPLASLDTFDFRVIPSLNKRLVLDLVRCQYIDCNENVLAVGNSGTGKTHIAL